ncbi:MAG TPA: class I SAM-dependent methyltransferase [Candidatus Hydrogenedentes bacterium]|nr:class I SAM-dependent methyltransferase [Candidatus Hydrogenedentota bacterium]
MKNTKRNFDIEAAAWDEEPRRVQLANDLFHAINNGVVLTPSMNALDFGCGTGLVTLLLAERTGHVTGVDSSQGMLEVLNAKIQSRQIGNVMAYKADMHLGNTLEKGAYDLIVSTMTLHHIPEIMPLLEQFAKALKPGGHVCLADLDPENGEFHTNTEGVFHYGFNRLAFQDSLSQAGFCDLSVKTAAEIIKPDKNGNIKTFTVFLATGRIGNMAQ